MNSFASLASILGLCVMIAACSKAAKAPPAMVPSLIACFGSPLPGSLVVEEHDSHVGGTADKHLPPVGIAAKLTRADFKGHFRFADWTETALSDDDLGVMHLPSDVPKSYMTRYVGSIDGRAAKVFWSDYEESFVLLVP